MTITSVLALTVPAADQVRTSAGAAMVMPLTGVTITNPNSGSPTEIVTITPSSTTLGTLADPSAATDGSSTSNGAITLKSSAFVSTAECECPKDAQ